MSTAATAAAPAPATASKEGLKVIGASFGRTATKSTYDALNVLGFKTYHMYEAFQNQKKGRNDFSLWSKLYEKKATSADIDALFEGYDAAVDFPACSFIKEFLEKYPDAKVIFSERDPEAWRKSVLATIYSFRANRDSWTMRYILFWNKLFGTPMGHFVPVSDHIWAKHIENDERLDGPNGAALAAKAWAQWTAHVKAVVPPAQLLIVNCDKGLTWEPICAFLNKPVPNEPFPRVNDTESFQKMSREARMGGLIAPAIGTALLLSVIGGTAFAAKRLLAH